MKSARLMTIAGLTMIGLLLVACGVSAPTSRKCGDDGLCIDLKLQDAIQMNEPVAVTITLQSKQDLSNLQVRLWFSDPDIVIDGENEWVVDIQKDETQEFLTTIQFPHREGHYQVLAGVMHPAGRLVQTVIPIHLTYSGGTLYPEPETSPDVPILIEPVTPTVSPEAHAPDTIGMGAVSQVTAPTFVNAISGHWDTIATEGFDGIFPPTIGHWVVQDLSNDGYQRYWDDDNYSDYSGGWAAWPARGGAEGLNPVIGDDHYPNNMDTRMIYGPFDLGDAVVGVTEFYLWWDIEMSYDYLTFEVSHDGVAFEEVARWTGTQLTWELQSIEYPDYLGDDSVWVAWRFYSDITGTRPGPWVDDVTIKKFVPGAVTIQGSLHYYNHDDQYLPVPAVSVSLYDDDGDPGWDESDDLLASTTLTALGTFEFASLANWDSDDVNTAPDNRYLDLYVLWETINPASAQRVTSFNAAPYGFLSGTQTDVPDAMVEFHYQIPNGANTEPAMWIFQDMYKGWDYIVNTTGDDPGPATIKWQKDAESLFPCSGSCFWPSTSVNGVFIDSMGQNSYDVVLHELGHHYMYNAIGAWWWSDIGDALACQNHSVREAKNALCAWAEGWATFYALAVNPDDCFDWDNLPCQGFSVELETPTWGTPDWHNGDEVEGRVVGALYDIFDANNDGFDQTNLGFTPIWDIAGDTHAEYAFAEFWNKWQLSSQDQHLPVQAIYQNTIDYNTPPLMLLPDRKVLEGHTHIDNAIALGAYTVDAGSDSGELQWEITVVSDWRCNNVSIDSQNYVDIDVPLLSVQDACDITIRVTDGLRTAEDAFNIQVVPVVSQVNLPLIMRWH